MDQFHIDLSCRQLGVARQDVDALPYQSINYVPCLSPPARNQEKEGWDPLAHISETGATNHSRSSRTSCPEPSSDWLQRTKLEKPYG